MSYKILIADDEPKMRILVGDFLRNDGFEILEASDGEEALEQFYANTDIDLVILDVMMPRMNGWEVCEEIRTISSLPIIMLTAKNTEQDELTGFHKGSDEYVTKPFSPSILVARVKALLKRTYGDRSTSTYGDLTVDYSSHSCTFKDISIKLSQTEFKLLEYLIQNKGNLLSREQLLNHVWGFDYDGTDRTVDSHMNRLRTKLGDASDYIHTVRGFGYKFEVN